MKLTQVRATHAAHQTFIAGVYDDLTVIGYEDGIVPGVSACIEDLKTESDRPRVTETESIGLVLRASKCIIYPQGNLTDAPNDPIREMATRHNLPITKPGDGIVIGGVPIGPAAFQQGYVRSKVDDMEKQLGDLLTVAAVDHESRSHQCLISLIRLCLPAQLTSILRTVPPSNTESEARRADHLIASTIGTLIGVPLDDSGNARVSAALRRLHLSAREGGLGIHSLLDIRHRAYFGSWALVGEEVALLLSELQLTKADCVKHAAELQPTLDALRASPCHAPTLLAFTAADDVFSKSTEKIQHKLMQEYHKSEAKSIRDSTTGTERAAFVSGATPEARAFLFSFGTYSGDGSTMDNADFDIAIRLRLHLPVLKPMQCPGCHKAITEDGHHAFVCSKLQDQRTMRHTRVQDAVLSVSRNLKHQNIRVTPNKNMDSFVKTPAGMAAKVNHRMDIEFINTNEGPTSSYVVDFKITAVTSATQTLRSAALAAEEEKIKHYTTHYVIPQPDKRLIPWAIEAPGGAWGPRATKFARYLAEQQQLFGGLYKPAAFYRMIVVRVAVALQCMNAAAVRRLDAICQAAAPQQG